MRKAKIQITRFPLLSLMKACYSVRPSKRDPLSLEFTVISFLLASDILTGITISFVEQKLESCSVFGKNRVAD
jgi:hypothetical protein